MSRPGLHLTLRTKLFYGLGSIAFGVKDNGFGFLLLIYYNQVLGLPERLVGLGIMIALIVDAICDPIVGTVSDHLHSRWGRRHPFMYASAIPVAVSYCLLWMPPRGLSHGALLAYFVVLAVLVRIFITFYEIPSSSLAAELTDDYDERTSILGYRYFFGWWGGLTMGVLAFAVFLQPDAAHPVGVLNPEGYRLYGVASALLMVVAIVTSAAGTHWTIPHLRKPPPKRPIGFAGIVAEARETLSNRSFLAILGTALFAAMASGLIAALNVYFNTFFWELTSNQISVLVLSNFVSAAAALALTPRVSALFGGKKPAAVLTGVGAAALGPLPILLRLLGAFPANGSPALVPTLLVVNGTFVTLIILSSILVSSMLADVVEDSEITTERRSEGLFFAANGFVQKSVSGVGIFASTVLLSLVGFPAGAKPGEVDPAVVRQLGIVFMPTLGLLYAAALACLSTYRISRATHEANLARLARRRAAALDAMGAIGSDALAEDDGAASSARAPAASSGSR
ncbi:MAG TPA: MFS transporter [Candidatus Binatia bacterium]|nr:MFS transporter [Candidatus Binatia bacterium]